MPLPLHVAAGGPAPAASGVPVSVRATPLRAPAQPCVGSFVAHELPHITTLPGADVRMFEGNGAGVAIDDLDGDGQPDIVLANNAGTNTILWNEGQLRFRKESMPSGDARAVNIVDVDGDGRPDIVFTRRAKGVQYWHNTGSAEPGRRFELELLDGVAQRAYAMNWGDLDGDGDLDLVEGSYDAELITELGNDFLIKGRGGVFVYDHRGDTFVGTQLSRGAQALAVALYDFDGNGKPDIVVGNDFAVYDGAWTRKDGRWIEARPFGRTSHSTMSLDAGDIDNDGRFELFSTDMKSYDHDIPTLAVWQTMMTEMWEKPQRGDPQIVENVLQAPDGRGGYRNEAYDRGIDATGWSWSGKFGDLDDDGHLDLYVVNGMAEARIFRYLLRHELVEQNQALRNDGHGNFSPAPQWGLGSTLGGRGMSMADLDGDGRLEIVVNNLRGPAMLYENRLCGGQGLEVDLRSPATRNTRAIGAILALHTSAGTFSRDVRVASGYLSGDPSRAHFGIPDGATVQSLDIRWPDGRTSIVQRPAPQTLLTITR